MSKRRPDPARDIEIVAIEMALADLASLAKRIERLEREARHDAAAAAKLAAARNLHAALEDGRAARTFAADSPEAALARECFMLTIKPMLYVANVDESQIREPGPVAKRCSRSRRPTAARAIALCGQVEAEFARLSG